MDKKDSEQAKRFILSGLRKEMAKTKSEFILELLFNLQANVHDAIQEFKSNRVTQEKAIENMNLKIYKIRNLIKEYMERFG